MKKTFLSFALAFACAASTSVTANAPRQTHLISSRSIALAQNLAPNLPSSGNAAVAPRQFTLSTIADPEKLGEAKKLLAAPTTFEPAQPRAGGDVQFTSRAPGMDIALTSEGISVAVSPANGAESPATLKIGIRGTHKFRWHGESLSPGEINYFLGNDPSQWRTHVANYARAEATSSSGIGLSVHSPVARQNAAAPPQGIEYDIRTASGVDPTKLRLNLEGASDLRIAPSGALEMHVAGREISMNAPAIYEEVSTTPRTRRKSTSSPRPRAMTSSRSHPGGAIGAHKPRKYSSRSSNSGNAGSRKPRTDSPTPHKKRPSKKIPKLPLGNNPPPAKKRNSTMPPQNSRRISGGYVLEADGSVGLWLGPHDSQAAIVIDPSISLTYESFLGGAGADAATSIALDSAGNIYVGGITNSAATFPEGANATYSTLRSSSQLFLAKIAFSSNGAGTLEYLDFFGGSNAQFGGQIAVDAHGNAAILGTSTSTDYPVTDTRAIPAALTNKTGNAVAISEVDPTGANLIFSTLFGADGSESQNAASGGIPLNPSQISSSNIPAAQGGIAFDAAGNIYIASDTTSKLLPTTPNAYSTAFGGAGNTEGFLAEFQPQNVASGANDLLYCTYLNTGATGSLAVGGVAVDTTSTPNVYIAGVTTQTFTGAFFGVNALQSAYGGGSSDAFLMKIAPVSGGATDLIYATLLGGSGMDEALGVAIDTQTPPNAYVVGASQSPSFPEIPVVAGPSLKLFQPSPAPPPNSPPIQNAFLAVVSQLTPTQPAVLQYFTYLGGSKIDAGQSVSAPFSDAVYIAGTTTSYDFAWHDNLQPFNGALDAFIAELDTSGAPNRTGPASLFFVTPLGGTFETPNSPVSAAGNAIVADGAGHVYLAGQTTASDFPTAVPGGSAASGFQGICASCQQSPAQPDGFISAIQVASGSQPAPSFNIPLINFGSSGVQVGTPGVPQPFVLTNTGDAPLHIPCTTPPAVLGPNATDFSVSPLPTSPCPLTLQPSQSWSGEVSFTPSAAGLEGGVLAITDDAPGSPQLLEVLGTGAGALSVSPAAFAFNFTPVNPATPQEIVVTVTAGAQVTNLLFTLTGPDIAQFNLAPSTCAGSGSLNTNGSCTISFLFAPNATGTFHAEADLTYQVNGIAAPVQKLPLTGTAVAAVALASVRPTQLTFGNISVGAASGPQSVTIANTGLAPLGFTQPLGFGGADPADFLEADNCPTSLAPGASCTAYIRFSPQSGGSKSASLAVTDNASGSPQLVALTGTATSAPSVLVSPSSWGFAAQSVGSSSAAENVTITNTGSSPLAFTQGISITGTNAADFSQTNNCNLQAGLQPLASCTVAVVFAPKAAGNRTAALNIADAAPDSPQLVALTGTAVQAGVTISPASVPFGGQQAGTKSSAQSVVVTNSSSAQLTISKITITGPNASEFLETDNCQSSVASTCTIQVVFAPACQNEAAARSATLSIQDNAPSSPQNVPLTGTANGDFCVVAPASGLTQTVLSGVTANFPAVVINSVTSFSGAIALSCNSVPAGPTCTFAPSSSVNVSPNVPGQFQVQATMGPVVTASLTQPQPAAPSTPAWPFAVGTLTLAFAALTASARARRGIFPRAAFATLGLAALSVALAACGAGLSESNTAPQPASGSFTLTVTASEGTETQNVVLQLNVTP